MTDCTTTGSFAAYGVPDGGVLVNRMHRSLVATDEEGPYTTGTFDRLERAFRAAFADVTGLGDLPEPVALALEDALYRTREHYLGATADLRTDVVTDFYRDLAGYHCAYTQPRSVPDRE